MSDDTTTDEAVSIDVGQTVCTPSGDEIGEIRGFTSEGVEVALHDEVATTSPESEPGQTFGEGYLMWECEACGEMGDLEDGMPDACPSCGASKEHLFRARED
ncbi:DUF7130 family rubredoxin-like protein [Haloarchaeobius amylolyticus]|uniref:DUF7130 family rubredoxin-like protein n=1 Tax=Haloarchaeobius amylolyticus TaxID=1198296 RepID=UPI0022705CD7|nr:hypothetical protein [Haloarchaeobius amylolyticus]